METRRWQCMPRTRLIAGFIIARRWSTSNYIPLLLSPEMIPLCCEPRSAHPHHQHVMKPASSFFRILPSKNAFRLTAKILSDNSGQVLPGRYTCPEPWDRTMGSNLDVIEAFVCEGTIRMISCLWNQCWNLPASASGKERPRSLQSKAAAW